MKSLKSKKGRVLVAMSGGIDSSMSLVALLNAGYEVVGVTLKLIEGSRCCDIEAQNHAKTVCKKYGVEHYTFDVSKNFEKKVIGYYLDELRAVRTPNPCVICNRFLKFDELFKIAKKLKCDYVATGHYARINKNSKTGEYQLLKGSDKTKDQTYYLSFLKREWLEKILFPLGGIKKEKTYKSAEKEGLNFLVQKKESQDLCFVDDKLRKSFLAKKIGEKPGDIVDENGIVLGKHNGIYYYTIGQRKGILLSGGPYFVIGFNVRKNQVIVSNKPINKALYTSIIRLKNVNFVSCDLKFPCNVKAKVRYQQELSDAILDKDKTGYFLQFKKPQRAVTNGQIAVFYKGQACLGGGTINASK